MTEIKGVGRITFHEGQVDEFKRLTAHFMEVVRARDTGTLQFEIYLNDDETEAVIYERYRDSEALIEHGGHIGELMPAIFATGTASSLILGEPNSELAAMTEGGPVPIYRPFLSL